MFNSILNIKSGKQMQQTNPLSPHRMTPEQRVHEVANIIANGLIRLREPAPKKAQLLDSDSDISLAMPGYRSVHVQGRTSAVKPMDGQERPCETENANTSEEKWAQTSYSNHHRQQLRK